MLDTKHHQGLRLALGAFRTSPVERLYTEARVPSLHLRREKLSLQYATRISSNWKIQLKILFSNQVKLKNLLTNQRNLNH
jgi:hypothetical protein